MPRLAACASGASGDVKRSAPVVQLSDRKGAFDRLVRAYDGDVDRARAVLEKVRQAEKPDAYLAACERKAREERFEAERQARWRRGEFQPGEQVTVNGVTYTANECGRLPYHVRCALEAKQEEEDRPASRTPDGRFIPGTGRYRGYDTDGRYVDPGI